jgi:putative aldouronate transport system substrate-binding protein
MPMAEIVYGSRAAGGQRRRWRGWRRLYQAGLIDPEFATKTTDKSNEIVVGGSGGHHDGAVVALPGGRWRIRSASTRTPTGSPSCFKDKDGAYTFAMGDYTYSFVVVKKGYAHPEIGAEDSQRAERLELRPERRAAVLSELQRDLDAALSRSRS